MPVEIKVPSLGESIVEATIMRWIKKEGDPVASGESIVELETDKVNTEIPAEQDGVMGKLLFAEGSTVNVGQVIATIAESGSAAPVPIAAPAKEAVAPASLNGETKQQIASDVHATPIARRIAEDAQVDLSQVKGSGPHGRIVREDVASEVGRRTEAEVPVAAAPPAPVAVPTPAPPMAPPPAPVRQVVSAPVATTAPGRPEERVRLSRRRQTIATRLVEAQHTAAMLTTFNEVDLTNVMEIRKRRKDSFKEKNGVNLGFMSFFTKASLGALKAFPHLNAEIQGDEMIVKKYYDIGVAVSTEEGLVVPVLRDADRKSFAGIEKGIVELATKAREGKLAIADLQGGTFTITNGGVFGSLLSTPILNAPQVGILGMHKIQERPIAVNGEVVIRPMMYLALSYDHRIVDGSEAVRFLVKVKELLEDPESLLLEG